MASTDVTRRAQGARASRRAASLLVGFVTTIALASPALGQEVVEYYALDALGSVRVVFDAAGAVIGRMDYDPFGAPLAPGVNLSSRAYAGLFRDGEAGLDFAQARSYQGRTGRFSTVDPIYAGLFAPQAWNRYAYVLNQTLMLTDAAGLLAEGPRGSCYHSGYREEMAQFCDTFFALNPFDSGGASHDLGREPRQRRGRDGTPPPPPPPPMFNPTLPAPQTPPGPTPDTPTNNCHEFARQLAVIGAAAVLDQQRVGWNMMSSANQTPDPWEGKSYFGFKSGHTDGQGDDVYRHLFAYSGAVLASESGGGFAILFKGSQDVLQWVGNKRGARAEVLNDLAGVGAGVAMRMFWFAPSVTTRIIKAIACE